MQALERFCAVLRHERREYLRLARVHHGLARAQPPPSTRSEERYIARHVELRTKYLLIALSFRRAERNERAR